MEMIAVALLVSAIIVLLGFLLRKTFTSKDQQALSNAYLSSIAHLLNNKENTDLNQLLDNLPLTEHTLDVHLAFGDFLRKRGDLDKAVAVHKRVAEAPVPQITKWQATLALALDFQQAGLLDRAEVLLSELAGQLKNPQQQTELFFKTHEALANLFQSEGEWLKAIEAIKQIRKVKSGAANQRWAFTQAHYYCELAEQNVDLNLQMRQSYLEKALLCDPRHARARLWQACNAINAAGDAKKPLMELETLLAQQPEIWKSLDLAKVDAATRALLRKAAYLAFLRSESQTLFLPALSYLSEHGQDPEAEAVFIAQYAAAVVPSDALVKLFGAVSASGDQEARSQLRPALKSLADRPITCTHCGFESQDFFWCCPTCQTWR